LSNQSTAENSLKIALGKETDAPIKDIQSMALNFEVLGDPPPAYKHLMISCFTSQE
jgi:hypothetical protein